MTKNNDWQAPSDEEKELSLYWIKRNRNGNTIFLWFVLAWNNGSNKNLRYKEILPDELSDYLEWYYQNI